MICSRHIITGYDVLPDGRIKPSAILKQMQDAATVDANMLGADYASMRRDDMIFVITKAKVNYSRVPLMDEELEIRTWNGSIQGVAFNRDFVFTIGGKEVGRATTRWVLVSYNGRRILRPDSLKAAILTNTEEDIGIAPDRRIKLPDGVPTLSTEYMAPLTDMDSNFHVNNSRYADYLVDYCGVNVLKKDIHGFEIHFSSEIKYGESVELVAANDGGKVYMAGNKADGRQAFTAFLEISDK